MHQTAMHHGKLFFDTYAPKGRIADLGAQDINGSLRSVAPRGCEYVGIDFAAGNGVDVVIEDAYSLPFEDESFDVCVTSSCFEHSEFFWLSFLEALRILKPWGLLYLNVPSNGPFHRHPVDCWRFYPDSGRALERWGQRNGINLELLESFTGQQKTGHWNDFVAVYVKDRARTGEHPRRILSGFREHTNALIGDATTFINQVERPEDQRRLCDRLRWWWLAKRKVGPN